MVIPDHATEEMTHTIQEEKVVDTAPASNGESQNPKLVLFLTLGFGLVMMVATIFVAVKRKTFTFPYRAASSFQFSGGKGNYRGLESDLRMAMSDEEIFIILDNDDKKKEQEYQEYLEDQSILQEMSKTK